MLTVYRDKSDNMPRRTRTETPDERARRLANLKNFTAEDTSGTVALSLKVPPELKEWVNSHAQATGKSASQIGREALEMYRAQMSELP